MATTPTLHTGAYPERDLVELTIQHLVDPAQIAGYITTQLAEHPFVADKILGGRQSNPQGIFLKRDFQTLKVKGKSEAVAPLGEYPSAQVGEATVSAIPGTKEGFKQKISDERMGQTKGVEGKLAIAALMADLQYQAEDIAMGVIQSAASPTFGAGQWNTVAGVVEGLMNARTEMKKLRMGFAPSLFVLNPQQYAHIIALFIDANKLHSVQEAEALMLSTGVPKPLEVFTLPPTWKPLLVDPRFFGSIGHWEIPSPEYTMVAGSTIEVASTRMKSEDGAPLEGTLVQMRKTDTPFLEMEKAGLFLDVTW